MSADTGILGAATVTTGDGGKANVTFSSGSGFVNRTATVTATSEAISVQIPVQMVGSTVTVTSTGTSLPDNGTSPVTLTAVALDAGGNPVPKATMSFTKTGAGNVTITPASGVTDDAGKFSAVVAGVTGGVGPATVSAAALGAIATAAINVTPTATTFAIDQQKLNGNVIANTKISAMQIGQALEVRVNAPNAANVTFATTTGTWTYAGQSQAPTGVVTVPVVAGKATATLRTTQASVATVQVYDPLIPGVSDLISVAMTSAVAASITLQATPSVVPRSVGTTTGSSTLIAMVRDSLGFPVGNAPVSFTIITPTGGGEIVSPAVVLTAATTTGGLNLGEARSSFTSGTLSSTPKGVLIRAAVIGTNVATEATGVDVTPSSNDIAVVIGGTAGSVAFGQATAIKVGEDLSTYILPMSVLVADSNGNPAPLGTIVNLSAWPHAWSTGSGCKIDADDGINKGTFLNEDLNENLILDLGEDGYRQYAAAPSLVIPGGKPDGLLTPTNSSGGTLPATLTTDSNGVAAFNLVYPKTSAIWTTTRIRARTVVQGSDAVGQIIFVLPVLSADTTPLCILPPSPYVF